MLAAYRGGTLSPVEVVDALLARIADLDPELGAFTTLCAERAREEAIACEHAYARGDAEGALAGVPFAVKDLFDSAQVRTTYGSSMFAANTPAVDAVAVRRGRVTSSRTSGPPQEPTAMACMVACAGIVSVDVMRPSVRHGRTRHKWPESQHA